MLQSSGMDQIGKYIVLEEIGQGGMGIVYKAHDPLIGREVAVKVIIERIMRTPELKGRFLREIASVGCLSHENIMTIYDAGDHEGRPYFVMELLSGTDLSAVIRQRTLSLDQKLAVAQQIARGLRYAHEQGVIHRDIKPDNVRVLDSGRAKIMDFGIARLESATRTPTHSSIGTPRYMSPEQIKGEHIDRRTDIFSFGALLYELLTGSPPFTGDRITTVIYQILHENPAPMQLGDVPGAEALHRVVDRCLEKELDKRYGSFDEVIADLAAVVAQRHAVMPTATALPREPTGESIPLPIDDETEVESLRESVRPGPRPSLSKLARTAPVRALVLGGVGVLAVLWLAYVIAQPGGEPDVEPGEAIVATADSPAARPFILPLTTDSTALTAALPPVGEPAAEEPAEEPTDEPAGESADEAVAAAQRQAEAQRTQARSAKARAARSGAEADPLYERALAQERSGDAALRRGTADGYAAAQTAYAEAARLYGQAQRAAEQRQQAALSEQREQAERREQAMTQARAAVVDRRADPRIAAAFQRAETHRTTGERQLRDGAFEQAAASFEEARALYAAAAQTSAQPPEPTPTTPERSTEPAPPEPSPEERAQAAAERIAGGLAARLEQALEQEDAAAMRAVHSTYDGWDGFFRIAENVRATVGVNAVEASGGTATADVSVRIRFRNTTKNADEGTNVRYGWTLEQRDGSWVLASVAAR